MIQLIQGDCLQILPTLKAGSVDAVITDPPYGMDNNTNSTRFSGGVTGSLRYKLGRDDWPKIIGDDIPFDPSPWLAFPRVVLFGCNHFGQKLPTGTTLVWIKRYDDMFGSFLSDAELAWMKGGCGVYCFRKNFPPPTRQFESDGCVAHPNQKPIGLMKWVIEKAKVPTDGLVLDPFMGSGTTGVACVQTGRKFIGCEIDPDYFAIAKRRIETAQKEVEQEAAFFAGVS